MSHGPIQRRHTLRSFSSTVVALALGSLAVAHPQDAGSTQGKGVDDHGAPPHAARDEHSQGWTALFDGKTLDGWKAAENPAAFTVVDGAIRVNGTRGHLYYMGPDGHAAFKDFHLKLRIKTEPNANSGVYFHTTFQAEGWPKQGYEAQVNCSHGDKKKTGSLYDALNVYDPHHEDNTWFTYDVIVRGRHVILKVDGEVVNDYTEAEDVNFEGWPGRRLSQGTFALQAHDPGSVVWFRDIKVKTLDSE